MNNDQSPYGESYQQSPLLSPGNMPQSQPQQPYAQQPYGYTPNQPQADVNIHIQPAGQQQITIQQQHQQQQQVVSVPPQLDPLTFPPYSIHNQNNTYPYNLLHGFLANGAEYNQQQNTNSMSNTPVLAILPKGKDPRAPLAISSVIMVFAGIAIAVLSATLSHRGIYLFPFTSAFLLIIGNLRLAFLGLGYLFSTNSAQIITTYPTPGPILIPPRPDPAAALPPKSPCARAGTPPLAYISLDLKRNNWYDSAQNSLVLTSLAVGIMLILTWSLYNHFISNWWSLHFSSIVITMLHIHCCALVKQQEKNSRAEWQRYSTTPLPDGTFPVVDSNDISIPPQQHPVNNNGYGINHYSAPTNDTQHQYYQQGPVNTNQQDFQPESSSKQEYAPPPQYTGGDYSTSPYGGYQ